MKTQFPIDRCGALLGAALLATPRLAACQAVLSDSSMAEPHVRVPEVRRPSPMPAGERHRVAVWSRFGRRPRCTRRCMTRPMRQSRTSAASARPNWNEPPVGAARGAPALAMATAAAGCRDSRFGAGAHFRSANDDGKRLGEAVSQATLAALPSLRGRALRRGARR